MTSPRARRASRLVLLAAGALAAVLLVAASPGVEAKRGKSSPAGAAACKKDADCVAVAADCCSCSEGGKQRAIPKKERARYEKERHERCAGTACTQVMSQDPTCAQKPVCAAGICELRAAAP
jgi:hypothetical protein